MSYDLCLQPPVQRPFYIENIRISVYSLEELCYYLFHNLYLIDETIINEKLCDWIRDELGMTRLYHILYEMLEKKERAGVFVAAIFREAGYLSAGKIREYQEQLSRLEVQPAEMKQKLRGDYLVKESMYARAISEYRQILRKQNPGKLGVQFYASVWNNLGAAYCGLFQYEMAADCFLRVYKQTRTKEALRRYISILPLFSDEKEYQERLRQVEAQPELVYSIQEYNASLCQEFEADQKASEILKGDYAAVLEELKKQYARSTVL